MIDTTAISFGINKLQEAFSSIQPKLSELTIQFIQYKVWQQLLYNAFAIIALVVLILVYLPVWKYGKGEKDSYSNFEELGFVLPTIFIAIGIVSAAICSVGMIPDTILAIKFPEMFTIQQMISSAK